MASVLEKAQAIEQMLPAELAGSPEQAAQGFVTDLSNSESPQDLPALKQEYQRVNSLNSDDGAQEPANQDPLVPIPTESTVTVTIPQPKGPEVLNYLEPSFVASQYVFKRKCFKSGYMIES